MATHPPARHEEKPPAHHEEKPKTDEHPVDPNRVKTVQEEQLERSREIEKVGVDEWVRQHDERNPANQPKEKK